MKSSSVERDEFSVQHTFFFNGLLRNHHWPLHCATFSVVLTLCQNTDSLGAVHTESIFLISPLSFFMLCHFKTVRQTPRQTTLTIASHCLFRVLYMNVAFLQHCQDTDNLESSQRKRYCIPMHFPLFFWVNMHLMDVLDHCAHIQHFRSILRMPQYTINVLLRLKALTSFFVFF